MRKRGLQKKQLDLTAAGRRLELGSVFGLHIQIGDNMEYDTTFRLVGLIDGTFGRTAASRELALLAPGDLDRSQRLGLERTEWVEQNFRPRANRSILIEVEERPGQWELGAGVVAL